MAPRDVTVVPEVGTVAQGSLSNRFRFLNTAQKHGVLHDESSISIYAHETGSAVCISRTYGLGKLVEAQSTGWSVPNPSRFIPASGSKFPSSLGSCVQHYVCCCLIADSTSGCPKVCSTFSLSKMSRNSLMTAYLSSSE